MSQYQTSIVTENQVNIVASVQLSTRHHQEHQSQHRRKGCVNVPQAEQESGLREH